MNVSCFFHLAEEADDSHNSVDVNSDTTGIDTTTPLVTAHTHGAESKPAFRRVLYDSDDDKDERIGTLPLGRKASDTRLSSDGGRDGTTGKKAARHKRADRLSDASPIVVQARGVRRAVISSDEEQEPSVVKPLKGTQKGEERSVAGVSGGKVVVPPVAGEHPELPGDRVSSLGGQKRGDIAASVSASEGSHTDATIPNMGMAVSSGGVAASSGGVASSVGVAVSSGGVAMPRGGVGVEHSCPSDPSSIPQKVAGSQLVHSTLAASLPSVSSPAFTKYRVPSSQSHTSPPSDMAAKKPPLPHIQSTHKPKSSPPQEGPPKARVVGGETGKKTSPVLFQPDNYTIPPLHKVTPPQSVAREFKVEGKPSIPKVSQESSHVDVKKSSPGHIDVKKSSPGHVDVKKSSPGGHVDVKKSSPGGHVDVKKSSPGGHVDVKKSSPGGHVVVKKSPPAVVSSTRPLATVPSAVKQRSPTAVGPTAVGPTAVGPTAVGPTAVGPTAVGPTAVGPTAVGPTSTKPTASQDAEGEVEEEEETDGAMEKELEFKVGHQYRTLLQQYQQLEVFKSLHVWIHTFSVTIHTYAISVGTQMLQLLMITHVMVHTCAVSDDTHLLSST